MAHHARHGCGHQRGTIMTEGIPLPQLGTVDAKKAMELLLEQELGVTVPRWEAAVM